ncbi:MAG TPA: hypothetical protein VLJ42_05180 [Solirubrobacteraceae bacterium]|nr:hypothetical protein [Solirubrobacteraceae bacterium]
MKMFRNAERRTRELDELTIRLQDSNATLRRGDEVREQYMLWLVCVRQIAASVDKAGKAAGPLLSFKKWWDEIARDSSHDFFRKERNVVLKDTADTIEIVSMTDGSGNEIASWVFGRGPHAGEPLVPRCQKYNDWLYHQLWAPACELLCPATLMPCLSFDC